MKSILKTFNADIIGNFALIGILSVLISACGSSTDSNDPRRFDDTGPAISLNTRPEVKDENNNVTQYAIGETVELDFMQSYDELGVTVRDLWDVNNVAVTLTQTPPLDTSVLGTYYVNYYAVDTSNNQSETLTRTIIVDDRSGPVITLSVPNPYQIKRGTPFDVQATSLDLYDGGEPATVTDITGQPNIDEYGTYQVTYKASDLKGNETELVLTVIVEPDYQDRVVVFESGDIGPDFDNGLRGYDQGIGWAACTQSIGCPNIEFGLVQDTVEGRGDVIFVEHLDTPEGNGAFIESSNGVNVRGAVEFGILQFDIWSESGVTVNVAADCGWPCVGGPVKLENVGVGEWQTIAIPATDLMTQDLNYFTMDKVSTFGISAEGQRDDYFLLDNIVWLCEIVCAGEDVPDREYTPWVKADPDHPDAYVAPQTYDGYTLVWNDEFDGDVVNTDNWNLIDQGGGFGNREKQYYRPENASVEDGLLVIEAQIQKQDDDPLPGNELYSSAKLTTENLFEFKQGRVDIRAVVAEGQGFWSAGWMLGANTDEIGWPYSGEVDIFDTVGGVLNGIPQEGMIVHNAYYNAYGPFDPTVETPGADYLKTDFNSNEAGYGENRINPTNDGVTYSNRFHVFSIDWNEERIRFLVDGVPHTEDFKIQYDNVCQFTEYDGDTRSCIEQSFDHTFYLILNVAVGGTWPGNPDWETTQFPRGMLVDYVRVYQKDNDNDGVADFELDGETQKDLDPNDPNVGGL